MRDHHERIRAAGAELVVVGSGQPEHARDFKERAGVSFELYVDPTLKAFSTAALRRSVLRTLGPGALVNAVRAFRGGHRQGKTRGDNWQLGGAFVIGAGGELLYEFRSRSAGDHPDPEALVAALPAART